MENNRNQEADPSLRRIELYEEDIERLLAEITETETETSVQAASDNMSTQGNMEPNEYEYSLEKVVIMLDITWELQKSNKK